MIQTNATVVYIIELLAVPHGILVDPEGRMFSQENQHLVRSEQDFSQDYNIVEKVVWGRKGGGLIC